MSPASSSGVSTMPSAFWKRVPAAGMRPVESVVLPVGLASRSSTSTSAPPSFAARAAVRPHAPAPMTSTGTEYSNAFCGRKHRHVSLAVDADCRCSDQQADLLLHDQLPRLVQVGGKIRSLGPPAPLALARVPVAEHHHDLVEIADFGAKYRP
jgi:hypothetical protein